MTAYRQPEAILTGDWLEANLADPALRIYDCTFYLDYEEGTGRPYSVRSGRADFDAGHIPGAVHLDLQADFSDPDAPTAFMHLGPRATASAFAQAGVGEGTRVVLYCRGNPNRATRFWWLLRWIGFDDAAILDGGMDLWQAEGRPVSTDVTAYPPGTLTDRARPGMWADQAEVLNAVGDGGTCLLNALSPDLHRGENARYGRKGRIPGSTNVPSTALIDPDTQRLVGAEAAAAHFDAAGATADKRIVNYCGGGIAATLDAFLQWQLGYGDIAVYDASMSEWAKDAALPIETD